MKKFYAGMMASMLVAGMLAAGCGGTDSDKQNATKAANELTVYTSVYNGMVKEMARPVVDQQLKDIKVNWQTAGSKTVKDKLEADFKKGKPEADIVMISDPSYYLKLKKDGRLLNYKSPEATNMDVLADGDGAFTPIRVSAMVIAFNADKLQDGPKSWQDLLDPKYKGKIAMPDPKSSGTALATVEALTSKYGWEYWEKLKANGLIVTNTKDMREKLVTGDYPITITMEESVLMQQMSMNAHAKIVYPQDGTILIPGYIAILKDTTNQKGAQEIVDWWLGKDGQMAMSLAWMHGVKHDSKVPTGSKSLEELRKNAISVDWVKLIDSEDELQGKFAKLMM